MLGECLVVDLIYRRDAEFFEGWVEGHGRWGFDPLIFANLHESFFVGGMVEVVVVGRI